MCLMLYLATPRPLAGAPPHPLEVSLVESSAAKRLREAIAQPNVTLVTVEGCSCAFPSLVDGPAEYFDGLLGDPLEHAQGAACVRGLLELVARATQPGEVAELFAVWIGEEAAAPKGRVATSLDAVDPERFWFVENHVYELRA